MKPYAADQEKLELYLQGNALFGQIMTLGQKQGVKPTGDKNPVVDKSAIVHIEAVTPVQQE